MKARTIRLSCTRHTPAARPQPAASPRPRTHAYAPAPACTAARELSSRRSHRAAVLPAARSPCP
eukprot:358843-Chlamydomonas_euryale.AAC.4